MGRTIVIMKNHGLLQECFATTGHKYWSRSSIYFKVFKLPSIVVETQTPVVQTQPQNETDTRLLPWRGARIPRHTGRHFSSAFLHTYTFWFVPTTTWVSSENIIDFQFSLKVQFFHSRHHSTQCLRFLGDIVSVLLTGRRKYPTECNLLWTVLVDTGFGVTLLKSVVISFKVYLLSFLMRRNNWRSPCDVVLFGLPLLW